MLSMLRVTCNMGIGTSAGHFLYVMARWLLRAPMRKYIAWIWCQISDSQRPATGAHLSLLSLIATPSASDLSMPWQMNCETRWWTMNNICSVQYYSFALVEMVEITCWHIWIYIWSSLFRGHTLTAIKSFTRQIPLIWASFNRSFHHVDWPAMKPPAIISFPRLHHVSLHLIFTYKSSSAVSSTCGFLKVSTVGRYTMTTFFLQMVYLSIISFCAMLE